MQENQKLYSQLGGLVYALRDGKVKRDFVEVYSLTPFEGSGEMPYDGKYLAIEYINDSAFLLCQEYGIQHPPVLETTTRAELPKNYGVTLRTVSYKRV